MKSRSRNFFSAAAHRTISMHCFLPIWKRLWEKCIFCLMLHRVAEQDENKLYANENMKVSPRHLECFILDAKRKGYSFIALSDLAKILNSKTELSRLIILTLDDGYRDNIENAVPIFREYGVPFTIFINTFFVESHVSPWWYLLENLLLARREIIWGGRTYNTSTMASKEMFFLHLRETALFSQGGAAMMINSLCGQNDFHIDDHANFFMNWSDLRALSREPLAELGNHGHSHVNLKEIGGSAIREEFIVANELIYENIGCYPRHYCVPYGLYDACAVNVLRELGAETCVTTSPGVITKKSIRALLELPRFMLTEGKCMDNFLVDETYLYLRRGFCE